MNTVPRTSEKYRVWWTENTDVPYGFCWCGCSQKTSLSKINRYDRGAFKDEPVKFSPGHNERVSPTRTRSFSNADAAAICEAYESGTSLRELVQRHAVSFYTVKRVLEQNGVSFRTKFEVRSIYSCNHSFFDSIDTEAKAYWLGFLAADGSISDSKNVALLLAAKDHSHVLRFRRALNATHPVTQYSRSSGFKPGMVTRITIRSRWLTSGLAHHGVAPRKTFTHEWPDFLSGDLLRHYLRGYFDGDGCFFAMKKKNRPTPQAGFLIVASSAFAEDCRSYLMRTLGFPKNQLAPLRECKQMRSVRYGGNLQTKRFADFIYKDASVFLPRKRLRIREILGAMV